MKRVYNVRFKKQAFQIFFLNQKEQRFIILLRMLTFIYIVHTYTVYIYMYKMFFVPLLKLCC